MTEERMPAYRGEPLDPDRGPGLGCFWIQVITLGILLVATPLSVYLGAPDWVSAAMLIITLVLLLFAAQTVIFLLRLVAADRRTRRRPMSDSARKTVGMMEDEQPSGETGDGEGDEPEVEVIDPDGPANPKPASSGGR
ncbi:MAG: DUF4149 domain-containing protein [Candidatus Limnocylindrales bacterium]